MITDNTDILSELKLYIKENYKLISFPNLVPGGKKVKRKGLGDIIQRSHLDTFSKVTDLVSGYIKEKRDYDCFAYSLEELRKEKGMSAAQLYKAAWIDKRLYSKIMATSNYKPAKNTAISFGLALKLNPDEFASFLQNAGFALSYSSIFDLVIRFCVERGIYDLHDVNALLLQQDQKTLVKEAA